MTLERECFAELHSLGWLARAVLLAGLAAGLGSCADYSADIDAVKRAQSVPGTSNEELVKQIAGTRGTVLWDARPFAEDSDDIILVTGTIDRLTRTGQKRRIIFEFLNDRRTSRVALERMLVDGRPQTLLTSALNLMLMELE